MTRYVLLSGKGPVQAIELDLITAWRGLEVIDRIGDRALLVELAESELAELKSRLPGWIVAPEARQSPPGPHRPPPPSSPPEG